MSLNFDTNKILDFEKNFPDKIEDGRKCWNSQFECVVFYCMFLDMDGVSETNIEEFLFRFKLFTRLFGHLYFFNNEDGERTGFEITRDLLEKLIGLKVNVVQTTRRDFNKKVVANATDDINKEIRKEATK